MRSTRHLSWTIGLLAAVSLSSCGGGRSDSPSVQVGEAASVVSLSIALGSDVVARPAFHTAAVDLAEPDNGPAPRRSLALSGVDTRGLTRERLDDAMRRRAMATAGGEAAPLASTTPVITYTPAQIRAAYGQPALPASTTGLTTAQAAQLGAGQTIYILSAYHDPNIAAELAAFNTAFDLPTCSTLTLPASASLPLDAASASSCELVVAYSTPAGNLTDTTPAYDSGWATESALDVQWAHATAPLARIVLIEAQENTAGGLFTAITVANKMGAGVVSMSWGLAEGTWIRSYDSYFAANGMSYVAATGDSGEGVAWPAVSSKVVAVGGTTLIYDVSTRSETTWNGTGGGTSVVVDLPSYQSGTIGGYAKRTVADVAFNADANTGQYVAVIPQGSTTTRWASAGGTSLGAAQWAGLLAVANAMRAASSKAPLGLPHATLYQRIGAVPTQYAVAFNDVTSGSNGTCATCTAKTGYDVPTGWGTPNAGALLTALSTAAETSTASGSVTPDPSPPTSPSHPVLTTTSLTGIARKPFSGSIGYSAANPGTLNFIIKGAAPGMTFTVNSSSIGVNWAKPVAGRTDLAIRLTDDLGQTSSGTVAIIINPS
jgi:subtilase family serine protease